MPKALKITLFYTIVVLALGAFWFTIALSTPKNVIDLAPDTKLQCLSYAPFGKEESPFDFDKGLKLSAERIDHDLALLAQYTSCIRTYSVTGLEMVPALARKHGLKMWLGGWIGADVAMNAKELSTLIALAKENADIVQTVVVGNEALLRRDVSPNQLKTYIEQVKTALPQMSITYADVWEFWNKHPQIAPAVDRITIHILPYWEDMPIEVERALLHVNHIRDLMVQQFPGKEVVIGETGWPSFGRMRQGAKPSLVNQAIFTRSFVKIAHQEGWHYNFIEAFDQPWKRVSEGAVGGYWGLFDANRADKHILHGFVSNYPHALLLWGASILLAFSLLPMMLRSRTCECQRSAFVMTMTLLGSGGLVWQGYSLFFSVRDSIELGFALIFMGFGVVVWYVMLYALITKTALLKGSMIKALRFGFGDGHWHAHTGISILHLGVLSVGLIMALGMAFDGRYRMFEWLFLWIVAIYYLLMHQGLKIEHEHNGLMERVSGFALLVCGMDILFEEGLRNSEALLWAFALSVIALRLSGFKLPVNRIIKPFLGLVIWGVAIIWLRDTVYINEALIDQCATAPHTLICTVRTLMGKMIYLNITGLIALGVSIVALVTRFYSVGLVAMALGLFCLLTFNGFAGAVAMVFGWWVVGYHLEHKMVKHHATEPV